MLHWYCKATYNLGQFFFFLKRHTIWDGGSIIYAHLTCILSQGSYHSSQVTT